MGLIKRKPQGSAFPVGTTVVSCTATDSAGNIATSSFNVIVEDHEDPAAGLSSSRLLCVCVCVLVLMTVQGTRNGLALRALCTV